MRISRLIIVLILGIATFLLLGIALFATDLRYYWRTIASVLGAVLWFTCIYLLRTMNKKKRTEGKPSGNSPAIRPFSMRTNVILVALGSFLLGVTGGILVYDSYWGLNDVLFKPSISLNINSFYGALLFGFFGAIGMVFLVIGLKNILWTK
jgi:hypothetical protein